MNFLFLAYCLLRMYINLCFFFFSCIWFHTVYIRLSCYQVTHLLYFFVPLQHIFQSAFYFRKKWPECWILAMVKILQIESSYFDVILVNRETPNTMTFKMFEDKFQSVVFWLSMSIIQWVKSVCSNFFTKIASRYPEKWEIVMKPYISACGMLT